MKIIFVDEIEQSQKNKNFFGVGAVIIDSSYYKDFKMEFANHFRTLRWEGKEFKGRYLFSQEGDRKVSINQRINFVREIVKVSTAKKNARYSFYFTFNYNGRSENNFLQLLTKIIMSIPSPSDKKRDKPVVMVIYDNCDEYDLDKIGDVVLKNLRDALILFERPLCIKSDNRMFGIITVDILNYLKSWIELAKDASDAQRTLFADIGTRNSEKLKVIQEIITNIKNIKVIK